MMMMKIMFLVAVVCQNCQSLNLGKALLAWASEAPRLFYPDDMYAGDSEDDGDGDVVSNSYGGDGSY